MVRCDRCQEDDRVEVYVDSDGIRRFRRKGSKYCFEGEHSIFMPQFCRDKDKRRPAALGGVRWYKVSEKNWFPAMQTGIDGVPANVENLSLLGAGRASARPAISGPDSEGPPRYYSLLNVALPNLKRLILSWEHCTFGLANVIVRLTEATTPNFEQLRVSLSHGTLSGQILLPGLKYVGMRWTDVGDGEWVESMLRTATCLEYFSFESVRNIFSLQFASISLREIVLQDLEDLEQVTVDAPNFRRFCLEDCPNLRQLRGLDKSHRLETFKLAKVPSGAEDLCLGSIALRRIVLIDVANLGTISLWVPNLEEISLFDCEGFSAIDYLTEHELASSLPADFVSPGFDVRSNHHRHLFPLPEVYEGEVLS